MRSQRNRLWALEGLEDRVLLTTAPSATIYTVNAITDTGAGSGTSGDLRYVIDQANANTNPGGSLIQFDPTVFSSPQTILLSSTLVLSEADGPEVIDGPDTNPVTISGNSSVLVFAINSGVTASFSDLTISDGWNDSNSSAPKGIVYSGGGLNNAGTATLTNCILTGNTAGSGGGIANSGNLTLINSPISKNSADAGGNIYSTGTLSLTNSTVSDSNISYLGGGLLIDSGTATLTNCTIAGNSGAFGGGVVNGGTLTLTNCTLSGNSGHEAGGLINGGTATLTNCTLADNSLSQQDDSSAGGIYNGGTLTLNNTIVANNLSGDIYNYQNAKSLSGSHNLVGTPVTGSGTNSLTNTIFANPLLGPLADNGGPTQTMGLLAYSPAINAGENALAVDPSTGDPLTTDQRGPGYSRIVDGTVDIGAFEDQNPVVPIATSTVLATSNPSSTYGQSVTFTATVTAGGNPVISGTVTFLDGSTILASGVPLNASGQASFITATLEVPASPHSITAQYSGVAGLDPSSDTIDQTVNPAPLTLEAYPASMNHFDPVPPLTKYFFTGFVLGQDASSAGVTSTVNLTTPATSNSPAGYYPIHPTATSFNAANYFLSKTQDGILTVKPKVMDVLVHFGSQTMSLIGLNRDLPFTNITAVDVLFSDDVSVSQSMLHLVGVNVPSYSFSDFQYDSATHDATWTLPTAIGVDQLMLTLNGVTATPQSGTGPVIAADTFNTSFLVLPGDVDGDEVVTIADAVQVRNHQTAGGHPYVVWDDVDGSGSVDATDILDVRQRSGWHLP